MSANIVLGMAASALPAFVPVALAAAPLCNGLTATIYVDGSNNIVSTVPGDNGDPYAGTLTGTTGIDVMVGTTGNDTINAGNNNDTICGLDGHDNINTGSGVNWVDAGDGNNTVTAGTGNDTIFAGTGNDTIDTSGGINSVTAGDGNNDITGSSNDDTITTGSGNDTIDAAGGTNIIVAGEGTNVIDGAGGNDTVTTGAGNDIIDVQGGTNNVNSGAGNDTITGQGGVDTVVAGLGDDVIDVAGGNNNVTAGDGNDSVIGTGGNDTFNGGNGTDYCEAAGGANTVTFCEASGNQGVVVVAKDTTPDTPGQAFTFTGTAGITSVNGESTSAVVLAATAGGLTYTAIESALSGWTLDSITCTTDTGTAGVVGTGTATFKLNTADVLTCTFANSQTIATTTTAVVSDNNSSTYGESVTFTATISGGATPTGTIQFKDGASNLGSAVAVAGAQAQLTLSTLTAGTHNITAEYSGDSNNTASTSPLVAQVVDQKTLTVSATGINKVYDTTMTATVTLSDDHIGADVVTTTYTSASFADKNVGAGKTVSVTGISITGGADSANYTLGNTTASTTADITAASLTVSAAGINKVYDGNDTASVNLSDNHIGADVVNPSGTATFSNKNVGAGKTVSVTGIAIGGADAPNYTLTSTTASTTADITAASLTMTATGINKQYDGNNTATVNLLDDRVSGDDVTFTYSATFSDELVGAGKTVSVTGIAISGGVDMGNYTLGNTTTSTTADITLYSLVVTATASDKTYDGGTTASVTLGDNRIGGDDVTVIFTTADFSDKNVANGKTVTVSGISISGGADSGNYSLSNTSDTDTADITAATLTATATASDKEYDGNTTAAVTLGDDRIGGDDVTLAYTSADFNNKNVGAGKTVTVTGISISAGADMGNYTLAGTTATDTADITAKALTVTANNQTKVFGQTFVFAGTEFSTTGLVSGDDVSSATITSSGDTPAASVSGSPYTISIGAAAGADVGNYTITYVGGTLTVTQASTTTALVSGTNPSMDTDTVVFTATVTGVSPTGNVVLKDGATTLDTRALVAGVATFSISGLAGGGATHSITAEYQGDVDHSGSTSNTVSQVVNTLPKLTVTKVVVNDNGGTQVIVDFPLFIDATAVTSGVQNTSTVGAHVVSETVSTQYAASIMIGDCDAAGNITLALNDVKACVITNDDIPATLTVIKQVINDNGGTKVESDFTMNLTGINPTATSFAGAGGAGTDVDLDAGGYSLTETADVGYAVSYSADCIGTMLPGDNKTCTVTNDDIQPKFTVTKVVVNNNGGTLIVTDFPLYFDGGSVTSGVQFGIDASASPYQVSELGLPSQYTAMFTGDCNASGQVTLSVGDVKQCTITNDDIAPTITVIKDVVNENGRTKTVSGFTLMLNGSTVTSGHVNTVNVGTYNITELLDSEYDGVYRGDCFITNGVLTLGLGQNMTCVIKNFDRPQFLAGDGSEPGTGGSSGHGVNRFTAAANFVAGSFSAPGAFGGGDVGEKPFTNEEKQYICAMQKTLETSDTDSLVDWLGGYMAEIMGRLASDVTAALKDPSFCASAPEAVAPVKEPVAIRINKQGYVVSSNPVWNACVRGKATLGLIKSNTDRVTHRQGSVEVTRPLSCDDYHTNDRNEWRHPDHPELLLSLDKKGKFAGKMPAGFIAVRDGSTPNVATK